MKLSDAVNLDVSEARYLCQTTILEDEEGPRWRFNYDNWHQDPAPDILLLGAYRHPSTGNNLVGGVNLHYISPEQRDELARALPEIMKQGNLKSRYWAGRRLVPEVFNNFYRTYNSNFVRGVQKDVMYPKYGYMKTAQKWLKKKLGGIFKSKAQRQKEAEPQYPQDLQSMQDRLDQAMLQLAQEPPMQEPQDSPEMQAARNAFQDFQRRKSMQDIERQEDEPFLAAQQDLDQALQTPGEQPAETYETEPPPAYDAGQPEEAPEDIGNRLEREQQARQQNLNDPNNELDPDADLGEAIVYYSPEAGHYIIEHAAELVG
jgi:hypothetical protein